MTGHDERNSVWEHLVELTDGERKALVDSAVTVLNQGVQPDEAITSDMPGSVLRSRMASALSEAGLPASQDDASAAMSSASGADAASSMLSALSHVQGLREEIEQAYQRRREMLFVDFGLISGPALMILLLKLKRIKIDSSGVDVQMYDANKSVIEMIRKMIGI